MNEKENSSEEKPQRPVAGMRALGLGAFCAFGVFVISIVIGMSSVLAGKKLLIQACENSHKELDYSGASEELYKKTVEKILQFADSASGSSKLFFSLGCEELNSLIVHDPQFAKLKGVIAFKPAEKDLIADISFPLEWLPELDGEGRGKFLNGEATFIVFAKKRELKMQLSEVRVNGEKLQIDMLSALQQINLFRYWDKYEQNEKKLNLVADVQNKDERLHFMNWKEKKKK